jgi:hypothetical protein
VRKLYSDPKVSWKKDGFANWIEHDAGKIAEARTAKPPLPTVRQGEYPGVDDLRPSR